VIDLGDTTGDRSSIPVPTIEVLGSGLDQIPDSTWNIKLIGNHEQYLRDTSSQCAKALQPQVQCHQRNESALISTVGGPSSAHIRPPMKHWPSKSPSKPSMQTTAKFCSGTFKLQDATLATGSSFERYFLLMSSKFRALPAWVTYTCRSRSQIVYTTLGHRFSKTGAKLDSKNGWQFSIPRRTATNNVGGTAGIPEYRQVNLEEFKTLVKAEEEHRYKVVLTSHAEAEEYYRHPLFSRHPSRIRLQRSGAAGGRWRKRIGRSKGCASAGCTTLPATRQSQYEVEKQELLEIGLSIANGKVLKHLIQLNFNCIRNCWCIVSCYVVNVTVM
jgi:hypothetical protein